MIVVPCWHNTMFLVIDSSTVVCSTIIIVIVYVMVVIYIVNTCICICCWCFCYIVEASFMLSLLAGGLIMMIKLLLSSWMFHSLFDNMDIHIFVTFCQYCYRHNFFISIISIFLTQRLQQQILAITILILREITFCLISLANSKT